MSVDFVLVSYNTLELTRNLYNQLKDIHPDEQIIIVDNASEDGTREWLNRLSLPKVILNDENAGFAKAANQGAAAGESEYICFLNTDVELVEDWLDGALDKFDDPDVVAVQPRLIKPDGKESKYNFPSGAATITQRWYFDESDGYDEAFPFGYEDIIFGQDIDLNGYKWTNSEPAILHLTGQSHDENTQAMLDEGQAIFEERQSVVVLRYIGGGRYVHGLPARDLTRADMVDLATRTPEDRRWDRERILATGWYEEVD